MPNIKVESDLDGAIKNINKALDLKKNFPPYIKLHLELVARSNKVILLKKVNKKYWSANIQIACKKYNFSNNNREQITKLWILLIKLLEIILK